MKKQVKVDPLEFWASLDPKELQKIRSDMKYGFLGEERELKCSLVACDFILGMHTPMFEQFEQGWEVTKANCRDMPFIRGIAQSRGPREAMEELERYFEFFQRMAAGDTEVWKPRVLVEGDFCRRFDGKHRVCLLRHFGVETVQCIVVSIADIEKWREKGHDDDKRWTTNQGDRHKRPPEAKRKMRDDQLRDRRLRRIESRKRQRRKRREGLIE